MRTLEFPEHITASSCAVAVSYYKLVAERGTWDEDLLKLADEQWNFGTNQGRETAMLQWWIASERGIESAQNNLAYVLDQGNIDLSTFCVITTYDFY
jgi:SEL1 protein